MTYKAKRLFATLVSKISTSAGLDASVVMHFINTDLERIFRERLQIHTLRLTLLDIEIEKCAKRESSLVRELRQKEDALRATSSRIEIVSASLEKKTESLAQALQDVDRLQKKLAELDSSVPEASRARSQLQYDLMMKGHRQRELTDKSARWTRVLLAVFALVGVIIAAVLVWRLNK